MPPARKKSLDCPHCPFIAPNTRYFTRHMRTHTGEKHLSCPLCSFVTAWHGSLSDHILTHTGEKAFKCELCPYESNRQKTLTRHVRLIHSAQSSDRPFKCSVPSCTFTAKLASNLRVHTLQKHVTVKPFKCPHPKCKFSSAIQSTLKQHEVVHTPKEQQLKCPVENCEYSTPFVNNLNSHMRRHSNKHLKPFACDLCPFRCNYANVLNSHKLQIHSDDRPFKCTVQGCQFAAKVRSNLNIHMKTHGEKTVECPQCPYRTKTKTNLKQHVLSLHTTRRDYPCGLCTHRAKNNAQLSSHMRTHTREKPYKCWFEGCQVAVTTRGAITDHVKNIHGDLDFRCAVSSCSFRARSQKMLDSHTLWRHSIERPFACCECDYRGKKQTCLRRHMKTHADLRPEDEGGQDEPKEIKSLENVRRRSRGWGGDDDDSRTDELKQSVMRNNKRKVPFVLLFDFCSKKSRLSH